MKLCGGGRQLSLLFRCKGCGSVSLVLVVAQVLLWTSRRLMSEGHCKENENSKCFLTIFATLKIVRYTGKEISEGFWQYLPVRFEDTSESSNAQWCTYVCVCVCVPNSVNNLGC